MSITKQALDDAAEAFAAAEEAYMAHLQVELKPDDWLTVAWVDELDRLKAETVAKENVWRARFSEVHGVPLPPVQA